MAFDSVKRTQEFGGTPDYYNNYTTTNLYVEIVFGGSLNTITVKNDSTTDPVQLSFDGSTLESEVLTGETLELNVAGRKSFYIKATAGGDQARIWGWADLKGLASDGATETTLDAVKTAVEAPSGISNGSKDVSLDGTAETLIGVSTACRQVWIWAKDTNAGGAVYVGGSSVSSTSGKKMYNGETLTMEIDDLQKIYIDVATNGDGVQFTYTT